MLIIKDTIKSMNATLDDAKKYAKLALFNKDAYPELSKVYGDAANSHVTTYNDLHKQIGKLIVDYRRDHGEPPTAMQAVYDWEHEQAIECMQDVLSMLNQLRS